MLVVDAPKGHGSASVAGPVILEDVDDETWTTNKQAESSLFVSCLHQMKEPRRHSRCCATFVFPILLKEVAETAPEVLVEIMADTDAALK